MIVVDANLLFYAYDFGSSKHNQAKEWLARVLDSDYPVGLPLPSVSAFLRVSTNHRLPGERFSMEESIRIIETWFDQPNVRLLLPGDRHWPYLKRLLIAGQVRGSLISDAQLSLEVGGELHTTDRDFSRFPGLRWTNPLEEGKHT